MKRLMIIALVLVLALGLLAGCRSRQEDQTNTTGNTQGDMLPDTDNMLPDRNDTVDPTNGANRDDVPPTVGSSEGMNEDTATNDGTAGENARGNMGDPFMR